MAAITLTPNVDDAVSLELHDRDPFYVAQPGPTLPIVAYDEEYAESQDTEGGRRVRSRATNPEGSIPLLLSVNDPIDFWAALDDLQQTVELCRRKGGELTYAPDDGTSVTYDLESIRISELPQEFVHLRTAMPVLEFTCRPYGRLAPITLVTNATSTDPIQSVSLPDIPGSVPALVEATITDSATQARDHLEVGLDDAWDGTAALLTDSASLSVSGLAGATATRTGAYSGATNNVRRATLATSPVGITGATGLTHKGRHRAKVRIYASGTGPVYLRAAWRIGSGPWTRNKWVQAFVLGNFSEVDLGVVVGNDSGTLTVRVEAYSETSGDTLDVDYLIMFPTAKYAKAKVPVTGIPAAEAFSYRDAFNQTAGNLSGKSPDTGSGTWTEAGTAPNFTVVAGAAHNLTRASAAARFATLGSATGDQASTVEVDPSVVGTYGVLARYVDTSNYLYGAITRTAGATSKVTLDVVEVIAGTATTLYSSADMRRLTSTVITLVAGAGEWIAAVDSTVYASGYRSSLDSGGTLATGKIGIYDSGSGSTHTFDNFASWTPTTQHVIAASGAVILDHESIARSDGTRPPTFEGNYLTCPPAGRESRTHRLAVKLRRLNVDGLPNANIADNQRVDVTVTPRVALL